MTSFLLLEEPDENLSYPINCIRSKEVFFLNNQVEITGKRKFSFS